MLASQRTTGRVKGRLLRIPLPLFTAAFWFVLAGTVAAATFHVSPRGLDDNPGTADKPFASVARAQAAARQHSGSEAVTVYLHGGEYHLEKPLVYQPEDSGAPGKTVLYAAVPGERPILSGGRRITGWQRGEGELWVARVPEIKDGSWRFTQLYVNGQLRQRARTPNEGFFRVAACPEGTPKTANYHKDCQTFQFRPGDIRPDWKNLNDVEVIVYHFWTDSHLPIQSIDTQSNLVTFKHKAGKVFTDDFTENGARYVVENVLEGLDQPGEWYLDTVAGLVCYIPKPGEDMSKVEVMAPRLDAFIEIRGNPRERQFVEHLEFRDLTFRYSRFVLPAGDSNDRQGSSSVTAAIKLVGARQCRFAHCEFTNLGTWAIEASNGCTENAFVGNTIAGVAAGGFRLNGGTENSHPLERNGNNVIADNHLHNYGLVYPSAVGILLMNTELNTVEHNHIHHGYYTGISIGWVWGYGRSISQGNRIEHNHIHDIGQGLLSDMGGIYTLGVSPGTFIRNNLIHDVEANQYGGWGIYHDEGSTHHLVESNVVYRTKFAPFNIHYAKEVTVRNNVFALGRLEQATRGRREPHKSVFLSNNIFYWRTGDLFNKDWSDGEYAFHLRPRGMAGETRFTSTFESDYNLFFNPDQGREKIRFAGATWEEWQKRGKDQHSLYTDPLFENADAGDFRLKRNSPTVSLGFKPIDLSKVGPRLASGPRGTRAP